MPRTGPINAIDARVVALTDRGLLEAMARASDDQREAIEIPLPWQSLRDDLRAALDRMVVSHKPDHGVQGKLHEETAYGFVKQPEKEGANLVYRKPFANLNENEIERIRDRRLREMVREHVTAATARGTGLKEALNEFARMSGNPHNKQWPASPTPAESGES